MLSCLTHSPGYYSLSSDTWGSYFLVFSLYICLRLSIHGQVISTVMTFFYLWWMNPASTLFAEGTHHQRIPYITVRLCLKGFIRRLYTQSWIPRRYWIYQPLSISKSSCWRAALCLRGTCLRQRRLSGQRIFKAFPGLATHSAFNVIILGCASKWWLNSVLVSPP